MKIHTTNTCVYIRIHRLAQEIMSGQISYVDMHNKNFHHDNSDHIH